MSNKPDILERLAHGAAMHHASAMPRSHCPLCQIHSDAAREIAALREALNTLAYEPIGSSMANDREMVDAMTAIARAALGGEVADG